jgi:hypothetical protein
VELLNIRVRRVRANAVKLRRPYAEDQAHM